MLDTQSWAKQLASSLSLQFHFLREQHILLRFKGTPSLHPEVAWCFLSGDRGTCRFPNQEHSEAMAPKARWALQRPGEPQLFELDLFLPADEATRRGLSCQSAFNWKKCHLGWICCGRGGSRLRGGWEAWRRLEEPSAETPRSHAGECWGWYVCVGDS